jgi:hypothetical protein
LIKIYRLRSENSFWWFHFGNLENFWSLDCLSLSFLVSFHIFGALFLWNHVFGFLNLQRIINMDVFIMSLIILSFVILFFGSFFKGVNAWFLIYFWFSSIFGFWVTFYSFIVLVGVVFSGKLLPVDFFEHVWDNLDVEVGLAVQLI